MLCTFFISDIIQCSLVCLFVHSSVLFFVGGCLYVRVFNVYQLVQSRHVSDVNLTNERVSPLN